VTARPQWIGRRRHWVLKDPLALAYFHLLDEEYAILQMLDGYTSLAEIQRQFEARFVPHRVSLLRLQRFLGDLHQRGLVLSDAPDQSSQLQQRRTQRRRYAWVDRWGNLLALRLPGIDPDRFLRWLEPWCRDFFTRTAGMLWLLILGGAGILAAVHVDELRARLPDFRGFFNAENLLWLGVTLAIVKVLHELGHAVACRHYGAECHDLGLMLLIFTPCLYCDVSDAWTLPNKWQRIAVSAAGIYLELCLAAVATFLWWFSEPGLLNSLCLNAMFVCSVSTLVFNGNPLLRFDGYYILADLLEVPNLQARARSALSRFLTLGYLGIDLPTERAFTREHHVWLAAYAVASTAYRWLVVVGTFFFLNAVLKPYHLELLAQVFMVLVVLGMVTAPVWRLGRFLASPLLRRQIRRGRMFGAVAATFALGAAAFLVPWPCRVAAPLLLQPVDARYVYVSAPGTLQEAVQAGDAVTQGTILARLVDLGIEKEIAHLTSEQEQQRSHIRFLESERGRQPEAAAQLPAAKKRLSELAEQLEQLRRRQQLLTLTAPADGTVLAPPRVPARAPGPGRLQRWSETPLEEGNRGSYLEAGTLLCLIGDPDRLQGVAVIDQADIEFVRPEQRVKIVLNQLPHRVLYGTITEIAKIDLQTEPQLLAAAGALPTRRDEHGVARPLTTAYQARIALDEHSEKLVAGAPGRCKITVAPQSLGQRAVRYLSRTFSFNL
jgi:putative peptide zinc metalloprotease protein